MLCVIQAFSGFVWLYGGIECARFRHPPPQKLPRVAEQRLKLVGPSRCQQLTLTNSLRQALQTGRSDGSHRAGMNCILSSIVAMAVYLHHYLCYEVDVILVVEPLAPGLPPCRSSQCAAGTTPGIPAGVTQLSGRGGSCTRPHSLRRECGLLCLLSLNSSVRTCIGLCCAWQACLL